MRIVIDMQAVQNGSKDRGIGRYTHSLVEALLKNSQAYQCEFILLFNALFTDSLEELIGEYQRYIPRHQIIVFDSLEHVEYLDAHNTGNRKVSELMKEKIVADLEPDFFLICSLFEGSKDNSITSVKKCFTQIPTAVILYDLIPFISPEKYIAYKPIQDWYFEKIEFLKKADFLFSISQASKDEAVHYLGLDPNFITNISSAADNEKFSTLSSEKVGILESFGITKSYIMHTSAYEVRKNFEGLIEAFSLLPLHIRKEYQLVLVCKLTDFQKEHLLGVMKAHKLTQKDVVLTGHVTDVQLAELYRLCYLFVFPSLHEGFGLPALEAMSCGAAVIGSDATSIPEVIGLSEALFNPTAPLFIAQKIQEVLENKLLWTRLKEHAKKQALQFSWQKSATILLDELVKRHQKIKYEKSTLQIFTQALQELTADIKYTDNMLLKTAQALASNEQKVEKYHLLSNPDTKPMIWRLEGPFDSTYSLALLNRETARALEELNQYVVLHSTEGPGDFPPSQTYLENNPDIATMYAKTSEFSHANVDVVTRNLYPPRVDDMVGKINMLHHYAWEESGFPKDWINKFNKHLSTMTCLSTHVEKIMVDAGISIPLSTSGCGVDHWERIDAEQSYVVQAKKFKFLHVSSCFPRKGVEALLEAYALVFTDKDDVSLVIKTFPNPHNTVKDILKKLQKKNTHFPSVVFIEDDMSDARLKALYKQCDVLVAPSCAEGFGLPMAEAMLSGLPVITTAWGGQLDFCNDENSWLIDYSFEYAKTHFELFNSVWAKVDVKQLSVAMQEAAKLPKDDLKAKAQKGRLLLLEKFKWQDCARNMIKAVEALSEEVPKYSELKIGWISSWKTKCGIATYSEHLSSNISRSNLVILSSKVEEHIEGDVSLRCWTSGKENNDFEELAQVIDVHKCDVLVIQFNYGFYHFEEFVSFVESQLDAGRIIVVMMHSTTDPFGDTQNWRLHELEFVLSRCHRILVHSLKDLNRLKNLGLVDNVTLFPHGILHYETIAKSNHPNEIPIVASYGFCLPHKGLIELIEVAHILNSAGTPIKLKMLNAEYPVAESYELIKEMHQQVKKYNLEALVEINNTFLEDKESLKELSSADLIVFPYQNTGESASGAVRYGLASKRPVAVTPLEIFEDLRESVFRFSGVSPKEIAESIKQILHDLKAKTIQAKHTEDEASRWREAHEYTSLGVRLENICYSLYAKYHKS